MKEIKYLDFPLVSVGIISYNRRDDLLITLSKILESDYPNLEIMVVDNASADDTSEKIKSLYPKVILCKLEKNIGIAARNLNLFQSSGKYIFLYDNDSMPSTPSTIKQTVCFLEQHPDITAVCTNVTNYNNGISETRGWERYSTSQKDGYYEGLFIHGAGTAYRREDVQKTRGFPDDFFLCAEEGDLTLQLVKQNMKIVYKPDIVTYHRVSPVVRDNPWKFYLYTRNEIWIFYKYFSLPLASWMTCVYSFKQFVETRGRPEYVLAFLNGTLKGLGGIAKQRKKKCLLDKEALNKTLKWRQQNLENFISRRLKGYLNKQNIMCK